MKRRTFLAAGGVVAVGGAVAAAAGFGGSSGGTPKRAAQQQNTAEITRTTLIDYEEVDGELGYGAPVALRYNGSGLVTWLPPIGSTVDRGQPLFKVNNEPVVLLFGELPLYRTLTVDVEGPDVKQLEENLHALGYMGMTRDEHFTAATATVVRQWQEDLGIAETGAVVLGQVLYAGGAIRVASHQVRVGDAATGDILSYTGSIRHVTVPLPVDQQRFAIVGGTVQVTLPDGKPLQGKVESVATSAIPPDAPTEQSGPATVEVMVSLADQAALGSLQQAPVRVRFVAEEREGVLAVPVAALVALAEGGYGVQVVEGASTRYVAVETGMFANGQVEIRGDVQAGMKVGVPN